MPTTAALKHPVRRARSLWPGSGEASKRWMLTSAAGAVAASLLTRGAISRGWRGVRGEDPPKEVASRSVGWPQALAWGALTGMVVGVARVIGRRGAAAAWEKTAGSPPPA